MNAVEKWSDTWDPTQHETEYAKKRIQSAKSSKLTPIKIDTADMYGYFQGSHGRYETFLDYCPCGDFHRAKLPCKHIYRLAMELGAFSSGFSTNAAAIPSVRKEEASLSETVDMIEVLSGPAQLLLLDVAAVTTAEAPCYPAAPGNVVNELITSGLVDQATSPRAFQWGPCNELKRHLKELGLSYDKKLKVKELQAYCAEHYANEMAGLYPELTQIYISGKYNRRSIHYYLHRKLDVEYIMDADGSVKEISLLNTDLPDDKVTDELVKRGYYKR